MAWRALSAVALPVGLIDWCLARVKCGETQRTDTTAENQQWPGVILGDHVIARPNTTWPANVRCVIWSVLRICRFRELWFYREGLRRSEFVVRASARSGKSKDIPEQAEAPNCFIPAF